MSNLQRVSRKIRSLYLKLTSKYRSDESVIRLCYRLNFNLDIDLDNPKTFNEKLNWLKLNYRNPILSTMADKYAVKGLVSNKIGKEYVVACFGVWTSADDIDFSKLPESFVLKTTHDSGGILVIRNKYLLNVEKTKSQLEKWLKSSHFSNYREWVYKDIQPRIIAEELLVDNTYEQILDYKFWCFNGIAKSMYISIKNKDIFENHYDMNFEPLAINHGFRRCIPEFEKPKNFELMKSLAEELSKGIPFVRVDFYNINGKVYFGEFTFYDWGGMKPFINIQQDIELGHFLTLPDIKN